jgi:FtsP/CotA-like multicopper oxidase with cupredoxin domain
MRPFHIISLAGGAALAATTFVATPAFAEKPGCEYKDIDVQRYGGKPFQNPPEIVARGGMLSTALVTRYTDPAKISIGGCGVKLRTYGGELVGPTLRAKPGDVLDILLDNQLPVETPDEVAALSHSRP